MPYRWSKIRELCSFHAAPYLRIVPLFNYQQYILNWKWSNRILWYHKGSLAWFYLQKFLNNFNLELTSIADYIPKLNKTMTDNRIHPIYRGLTFMLNLTIQKFSEYFTERRWSLSESRATGKDLTGKKCTFFPLCQKKHFLATYRGQ